MSRLIAQSLVAMLLVAAAAGCRGPAPDAGPAAASPTGATATAAAESGHVTLDDENLAAYARALARQVEIIRRPGRGTHYGVAISAHDLDGETGEVMEAAGMTVAEYKAVDGLVDPVFTTLNFQGVIGPPRSIDVDASPEWRERLEGDPFASLSPESAAALRRHMDTLVPLWSEIVGLTAQHGR